MSESRVEMFACGGTIASTETTTGATPSRTGADLVKAIPELGTYADISVTEVANVPGFDVTQSLVAHLCKLAQETTADGIIITHGTDTIEETAYYLDITLSIPVPLIVTGSQRRLDEPSSDAPANLIAAIRTVIDDRIQDAGGVYVAFNDELHAARDVTKAHTSALETFESPGKGPIATLTRTAITVHREPGSRSVKIPPSECNTVVPILKTGQGVDGTMVQLAIDAGADGIIVEGTGLGNVTTELGEAIASIADALPVVITSRCHAGGVEAIYGTPGGGATLRRRGVIDGGDLPAQKARVKLMLALENTDSVREIRQFFERGVTERHPP